MLRRDVKGEHGEKGGEGNKSKGGIERGRARLREGEREQRQKERWWDERERLKELEGGKGKCIVAQTQGTISRPFYSTSEL